MSFLAHFHRRIEKEFVRGFGEYHATDVPAQHDNSTVDRAESQTAIDGFADCGEGRNFPGFCGHRFKLFLSEKQTIDEW